MEVLELTDISKSYGTVPVLSGVTLCCDRGVSLCLVGANAAGKTTLLTIAAGLKKADSGRVKLDGSVGFIPQESALLEDLSVRENLMLWYAACGRSNREIFGPASVERKLGLEKFSKKQVKTLSGGYRKRTDFACALAKNPDYLLMDEPFTALDLTSRIEITAMLRELRDQGKGILFSSHDPDAIAGAADCAAVLQGGKIVRNEVLFKQAERGPQIIGLLTNIAGSNADSM